jgi:hypothetical protein
MEIDSTKTYIARKLILKDYELAIIRHTMIFPDTSFG